MMYHANTKQKKVIVLIFISYSMFEVNVKARKIIRVKEGHYIMVKRSIL